MFDNACDVDCNKCGFTRSTKHSFDQGVITKEPTTTEIASTEEAKPSEMPNVMGYEEEKALEILDDAGISYEIEREYSSTFEAGVVMSQSILAGDEVKEGDRVKLVISKGIEEVDVPSVVGKTAEEAKEITERDSRDGIEAQDVRGSAETGRQRQYESSLRTVQAMGWFH